MTIAHWLMKLARVAAPENRTEWAHAMSAEFDALDEKSNRTAWAAGCVSTVFAWRLQASALYLIALIAIPVLWNVAISTLIFMAATSYAFAQPISQEEMGELWMSISFAGTHITMFVFAAALSAYRPRYALFSAIVLWIATTGATFITMFGPDFARLVSTAPFSTENNHPALPNVVMALIFLGGDVWAVAMGGFAGWAFARGKRYTWTAMAAINAALAIGFAQFFFDPDKTTSILSPISNIAFTTIAAAFLLAILWSLYTTTRDLNRAWRAAN